MAIIYQNPLKSVRNPDTIREWIKVARDKEQPFPVRQDAIGKLRGAVTYYRHKPQHRAALVYLRQQVAECNKLLHSKEGQDDRQHSD